MVIARGRARALVGAAVLVWMSGCTASEGPEDDTDTEPPEPPVVVHWVGNSPDGMVVEEEAEDYCPAEFDLELDLTTSGTEVTGTAVTRLRRVEAVGPCTDVLGAVHTYTVLNGRSVGDSISFELGGAYRLAGTFSATRMTGTFVIKELFQTGRFVVSRP